MKKNLILTILIFTMFSCSSDNKNEIIDNSIVGNWKLKFVYDETGEVPIPSCRTLTLYSFKKDKNFVAQIYQMANSTSDCYLDNTINGNWKALGNSSFELSDGKNIIFKNNSLELRENSTSSKYQVLLPEDN